MKKIIVGAVTGLGFVSSAFAGPGGFSTIRINWSSAGAASAGAEAIPTLGTYGALILAVLLALAVYRVSRNGNKLIRAAAPLATFGLAASAVFMADSPVAGLVAPPPIDDGSGNGSQTYTADPIIPPPCFVNNSGVPVTVTYTFIDGEGPGGEPITAGTCTFDYFCETGGDDPEPAFHGATVPSDGEPRATAYCLEQFGAPS